MCSKTKLLSSKPRSREKRQSQESHSPFSRLTSRDLPPSLPCGPLPKFYNLPKESLGTKTLPCRSSGGYSAFKPVVVSPWHTYHSGLFVTMKALKGLPSLAWTIASTPVDLPTFLYPCSYSCTCRSNSSRVLSLERPCGAPGMKLSWESSRRPGWVWRIFYHWPVCCGQRSGERGAACCPESLPGT